MGEDTDWENYQTGPFCRHWSDPSDCDEVCATCGHKCTEHDFEAPGECMVDGCKCKAFADKNETPNVELRGAEPASSAERPSPAPGSAARDSGKDKAMGITGGFGMTMDIGRGTMRQWVMGRDGVKRWADTHQPVEPNCDRSACGDYSPGDCDHPDCPARLTPNVELTGAAPHERKTKP